MKTFPPLRGTFSLVCSIILAAFAVPKAQAQSTLIPLNGFTEFVFDHSGTHFYVTVPGGLVRPYNLLTHQFEAPYSLGGNVTAIDIAPDDSCLLVAQEATTETQGLVQRVDLHTRAVTNIFYDFVISGESGSWDVKIASNGLAFFTTFYLGAGTTPLRQIDLATNAVTVRNDVPGGGPNHLIGASANMTRSADATCLYFLQSGISTYPVFTYNAVTNTFSPEIKTYLASHYTSGAVNRNGTLLATQMAFSGAALDRASDFDYIHNFNGPDSSVAFDAVTDTLYVTVSSTDQIVGYDTQTFAERFRWNIGEDIRPGVEQYRPLVASANGNYIALGTALGIRLFAIPGPPSQASPPPLTSLNRRGMIFDHSGQHLYVTTTTGWIERFLIPSGQLDRAYDLGGALYDIDIAPDDSFLIVAQGSPGTARGAFQKVDVNTGAITNISYVRTLLETGAYDVAIASNGLAFGTTRLAGSGWIPVRQIDLSTNILSERGDVPGSFGSRIVQDTQIDRSADGSVLIFLDRLIHYSAATNMFVHTEVNFFPQFAAAVNRNGTLLGNAYSEVRGILYSGAPDFTLLHTFDQIDSGIAFDALADRFYGVSSASDELIAYDTNTYAEQFRINIGEDFSPNAWLFDTGSLVASPDGRYLAVFAPHNIRLLDTLTRTSVPIPPPAPTPTPTPTPTATPGNLTISLSASPSAGGTVSGGGTFAAGSTRTVNASPKRRYTFTNWTENGSVVSTSRSYTFTLNANRVLVANFTTHPVTVTANSFPVSGGSTTGGGTYGSGASVTLTGIPNNGFAFANWVENGNLVSTSQSYTFTVTANRTLTANFTNGPLNYNISTTSAPGNGGTTSGGGTFPIGTTHTVTATAASGYALLNWTENGNVVSTSPSYSFTVTADRNLVANFALAYTITASASPSSGGTVTGAGTFAAGSTRMVTATPKRRYHFVSWTESGTVVSTSSSYSFTLDRNRALVANFHR